MLCTCRKQCVYAIYTIIPIVREIYLLPVHHPEICIAVCFKHLLYPTMAFSPLYSTINDKPISDNKKKVHGTFRPSKMIDFQPISTGSCNYIRQMPSL